jgi:hypothetical protein
LNCESNHKNLCIYNPWMVSCYAKAIFNVI